MSSNARHTPTRRIRMTDKSWELLLRGAAMNQTSSHILLVGAITEALLRLLRHNIDITEYLRVLDDCQSRCMTYGKPRVMDTVRKRLRQYGYSSTPRQNP